MKIKGIILSTLLVITTTAVPVRAESPEEYPESPFDVTEMREWEEKMIAEANSKPAVGDFKVQRSELPGIKKSSTTGTWSWRDGVICITDSYASVSWFNNGHAGIVAIAPHYDSTVEANPSSGVSTIKGRWDNRFGGNVYQVGVVSTTVKQDQQAAQWACNQIGKPYGFPIALSNRSKFYCSHLVYAAYLETTGVNLDTIAWPGFIHPFELLNTSKTETIFQRTE